MKVYYILAGIIILWLALLVVVGDDAQASTLPVGPRYTSKVYLPIVHTAVRYPVGAVIRCDPNAGITYVNGMIYKGDQPVNGATIVFAVQPGEPHIAEIISGPHQGYPNWANGFFSIILGANGARKGEWYFWIIGDKRQRDSVIIHLHTDALVFPTSCQQALIYFSTH